MRIYRYILEPYRGRRTRHTCPACHKPHEFTRYVDTETGHPLAPEAGKCNRENKCGYHLPPVEYFRNHPETSQDKTDWRSSEAYKTQYTPPAERPIDYIPKEYLERSRQSLGKNNFIRFLKKLFGEAKAIQLAELYQLGTSKHWRNAGGLAVVFWQIDRHGNIRQAKVMAYNPDTGRRLKAPGSAEVWRNGKYRPETGKPGAYFAGKALLKNRDANLQQCLFGEHLLPLYPDAPVALVESEKTAVIMAGIQPSVIWLATGGSHGARWTASEVYQALEGRRVILFPDLDKTDEWAEKGKILGAVCHQVTVSRLLEKKAPAVDRREGYDIADYFIKNLLCTEANKPKEASPMDVPAQAVKAENTSLPSTCEKGGQKNAEADAPTYSEDPVLPPGWRYEALSNGEKVMVDADGLPAVWNYRPQNDREALAVFVATNPNVIRLIEAFDLCFEEFFV